MAVDFVVDETRKRRENNELLDPETGLPNPGLVTKSEKALAEVAAAINKNIDLLSANQLEQVAGWAKQCKISKSHGESGSRNDFYATLDVLRNSAEQKELQARTYWKMFAAWLSGVVFALVLLGMGIANWTNTSLGWGWGFGLGVVLVIAYVLMATFGKESLLWAKEQDRKYALASLRKARTVYELNEAGLFAYLRNTQFGEPGFEDKLAMQNIRAEVARLTDALYNDPEGWLLAPEYVWNQPES